MTNNNTQLNKVCLECNRQFTGIVSACPHDGTQLVELAKDPMLGQVLANNYEIISIIGQGGMGVVYKAKHLLMDRLVAIKMLHASAVSNSLNYKRLQQEGKATSRINHPNVITVYDFDIAPTGQPYIVMDYLSGIPLSDIIKQNGYLNVERTLNIIIQACDGLSHAHKQGVVHRDLKPTNIMLIDNDDKEDIVKIVDFGVAKIVNDSSEESQRLTKVGEICGSPVYMSPEQCQGLELDKRTDIYSLGIVLFESLTGSLPFFGKTTMETMSMHLNMPVPKLSQIRPELYIPERIEHVIARALAKNKIDRYQNMDEFKMAIETSIPRPAKSSILRSNNDLTNDPPVVENKLNPNKYLVILGVFTTLTIILIAGLQLANLRHIKSTTNSPNHITKPTVLPNNSIKTTTINQSKQLTPKIPIRVINDNAPKPLTPKLQPTQNNSLKQPDSLLKPTNMTNLKIPKIQNSETKQNPITRSMNQTPKLTMPAKKAVLYKPKNIQPVKHNNTETKNTNTDPFAKLLRDRSY